MSPSVPISCQYDHLPHVHEKFGGTGGDEPPEPKAPQMKTPKRPYAELRTASAFSFLDGASLPEDLVYTAAEVGVPAMALIDRNGVYGAPRFYGAAKKTGVKALVGSELTMPGGGRVSVLVGSRTGYKNLCKLITAGAMGRPKGEQRYTWDLVEEYAAGLHCLTRDDDATVGRLAGIFKGRTHVELQRHRVREEEHQNIRLI